MPDILIDSSFLFALFNADDKRHEEAASFVEANIVPIVVPVVVLPEVTFLMMRAGGVPMTTAFLESIKTLNLDLACPTLDDVEQARKVMLQYADSRFDMVDCIIMAMAERLDIRQVCTFDRRDFSMFRPNHCDFLELLP